MSKKEINRQVMTALSALQGPGAQFASIVAITSQVKYQMRHMEPITDVDNHIGDSLRNLTELGILAQSGEDYIMCHSLHPVESEQQHLSISRQVVPSHKRKRGHLNPLKGAPRLISRESVRGNKYDKARKRLRTNKRLIKEPPFQVNLPNVQRHSDAPQPIETVACESCINTIKCFCEAYDSLLREDRRWESEKDIAKPSKMEKRPKESKVRQDEDRTIMTDATEATDSLTLLPDRMSASNVAICGSPLGIVTTPSSAEQNWFPRLELPSGTPTQWPIVTGRYSESSVDLYELSDGSGGKSERTLSTTTKANINFIYYSNS